MLHYPVDRQPANRAIRERRSRRPYCGSVGRSVPRRRVPRRLCGPGGPGGCALENYPIEYHRDNPVCRAGYVGRRRSPYRWPGRFGAGAGACDRTLIEKRVLRGRQNDLGVVLRIGRGCLPQLCRHVTRLQAQAAVEYVAGAEHWVAAVHLDLVESIAPVVRLHVYEFDMYIAGVCPVFHAQAGVVLDFARIDSPAAAAVQVEGDLIALDCIPEQPAGIRVGLCGGYVPALHINAGCFTAVYMAVLDSQRVVAAGRAAKYVDTVGRII